MLPAFSHAHGQGDHERIMARLDPNGRAPASVQKMRALRMTPVGHRLI
jgi:hypothetical protein